MNDDVQLDHVLTATWRACILHGSNIIHASWMGVVFCNTQPHWRPPLTQFEIEDEFIPMAGTDAVKCEECQVALAKWFLVRRGDGSDGQ